MPNHVMTRLCVTGPPEAVDRFKVRHIVTHAAREAKRWDGTSYIEPAYRSFDFNTIIPRPAILDEVPASHLVEDAVEALTGKTFPEAYGVKALFRLMLTPGQVAHHRQRLANLTAEQLDMGRKALRAIEETGYPTWYEWCNARWGTKWNAYEYEVVEDVPGRFVFRFQTAWSTPLPVLTTVVAMHPDLQFSTDSFDEGWNFAAHGHGSHGVFVEGRVPTNDDTHEAAYGYRPERDDEESD